VAVVGELDDGGCAGLHLGTLAGLLRTYSVPYRPVASAIMALSH
jgi:hypothetical protein